MSKNLEIPCQKQSERAPSVPVQLGPNVRSPQYGRYLEEFRAGEVFEHPRGFTIWPGFMLDFAATYMEMNPLYLNQHYARAHGFDGLPASPLLLLNLALSQGVQNDSEKAIAHLGYYDLYFLRPAYSGDTIRSLTKVLGRKERGEGKPGIAELRTIGLNQRDEVVVQYDRKVMIPPAGKGVHLTPGSSNSHSAPAFPESPRPIMQIPRPLGKYPPNLTGRNTYFEDFNVGEVIVHANGRTVTDEHFVWTYKCGNTHPLHYDKLYTAGRGGPLSGEPVVYGGLVFSWLAGLASRDTSENALWDFGYTEGYHTQPTGSGDTLYALSRVLHKEDGPSDLAAGIVTFQLIGVKGTKSKDALDKYGADLFLKENDKKDKGKEKIPEKIFEIERRLLIKKRPA